MSHDARELLPCPFCGGEASVSTYKTESLWSHNEVLYTRVSCDKCDIAFNSERGFETEAPAAWNTRATLSPDPVLLGEVREWPDIGQDPLKAPRPDDRMAASVEHVRAAYVKQQPHVPDQTALVWRWHLGALLEAEIRLRTLLAKLPKLTGEEV